MMELSGGIGEPIPYTEQEIMWDIKDCNSDDADPLDLDVKEEPLVDPLDLDVKGEPLVDPLDLDVKGEPLITVKMEDLVTSSQNESIGVINDLEVGSHIKNSDDNQVIVSSSDDNRPVSSADNGPVLPTGLLLYKLFNQIIIDALLGTPKSDESLSLWDNSSLNVMANTQNWINKQNFSKGRYAIKKTQKKAGSKGNLITEKGKRDVSDNSKNYDENFGCATNPDVILNKKCDYCNRFLNKAVCKNGLMNSNTGSKVICSVCDVDRPVSSLSSKVQLCHKDKKDVISKENNNVVSNQHSNNVRCDVNHCDNESNRNEINADCNFVIVDSFSCRINNEFKDCSVVMDKIECHDKFYVCSMCDNLFYNLNDLNDHKKLICCKKDVDLSQEVSYTCDICKSYAGNTLAMYQKHLESHYFEGASVSLNFSCKYCDKILKSQSELLSHLVSHDRSYKYFCDKCNKKFNKLNLYKIHNKKIHGFVKNSNKFLRNYKKGSAKKYSLLNSKTLRSGRDYGKEFVCNICDKSFSRALTLKSHINKEHNRIKQFNCATCKKSFTRRSSLLSHTKLIHRGMYNDVFIKI